MADQEWWRQMRLTVACIMEVAERTGWNASPLQKRSAAYAIAQRLLLDVRPTNESVAEFGDRSRSIDILRTAIGLKAINLRLWADCREAM